MEKERVYQCLETPHIILLFLDKTFVNEIIMVEKKRRIKFHDIDFGNFLGIVGVFLLITENPVTKIGGLFYQNTIAILSG